MFDGAQTRKAECLHNVSYRTPSELTKREAELTERDRARFRAKVAVGEGDACWLWTASCTRRGYGQFGAGPRSARRMLAAHRVAWVLSHGPIPADAHVLHRCDRPRCCNPAHLFLGTHTDNMQDASTKGRLRIARKRTRAFKPEVIARYLAGGVTARELGAAYGISYITVHRWIREATHGQNQSATRYARGVHPRRKPKPKTEAA